MANDLFQIERSRKVVITIPGYNPDFEIQKVSKRLKRLGEKKKRRLTLAVEKQHEAQQAQLKEQEVALDELNQCKPPVKTDSAQGGQVTTDDSLFA